MKESYLALRWRDERGEKGHAQSPVWALPPHEQRKHFFFFFGPQTEIDSPPPYLGDSNDREQHILRRRERS